MTRSVSQSDNVPVIKELDFHNSNAFEVVLIIVDQRKAVIKVGVGRIVIPVFISKVKVPDTRLKRTDEKQR